jgi:hypothetical protein
VVNACTQVRRWRVKLPLVFAAAAIVLTTSMELSAADAEQPRPADRFAFTERFDFTIRVDPQLEDVVELTDASETVPEMNWVEVVRLRMDRPEPPPPIVPPGLQGVVWALENPAESWRMIFPIPPDQAPHLVLPADPPLPFPSLG